MNTQMADFYTEISLITTLSLLGSVLAFPLILAAYYTFGLLASKYPKIPRLAILYFVGLLAIFLALTLVEIYFGYTLSTPAPTG